MCCFEMFALINFSHVNIQAIVIKTLESIFFIKIANDINYELEREKYG